MLTEVSRRSIWFPEVLIAVNSCTELLNVSSIRELLNADVSGYILLHDP